MDPDRKTPAVIAAPPQSYVLPPTQNAFFLHILHLYATLWVMTDLNVSTSKNLARLGAF